MQASGGQSQHDVTRPDAAAIDDPGFVYDAHDKASQIVLARL